MHPMDRVNKHLNTGQLIFGKEKSKKVKSLILSFSTKKYFSKILFKKMIS